MKVSHEVPRCLLNASQVFNDYDYCLPHLLDQDEEYKQYFVNAFGGKTGTADKRTFWPGYRELSVDRDDSLWWYGKDNNDFINRGKTSFNTYVADLSNEESKKNPDNAASTNGFIPVELGLTVDG